MSVDFKGMNILITGASSGIGRQAAITYGKHNARVIALGRSQSALEMLDDDLARYNCDVINVPFNLMEFNLIKDTKRPKIMKVIRKKHKAPAFFLKVQKILIF